MSCGVGADVVTSREEVKVTCVSRVVTGDDESVMVTRGVMVSSHSLSVHTDEIITDCDHVGSLMIERDDEDEKGVTAVTLLVTVNGNSVTLSLGISFSRDGVLITLDDDDDDDEDDDDGITDLVS